MENFEQKIKSYVGVYFKKETSYEKIGVSPVRDWNMFLGCVIAAILIVVIFSGYVYLQITNDSFFSTPADTSDTHVTINKNLLQKTVQDITVKQSAFTDAQNGQNPIADPSL